MKFTKGNLALREHVTHGEDVHLFEEVPTKKGYLRYRGQMVCTGFDLVDAPDTKQNMRRAILFELVPLESFLTVRDEESPELPFGRDHTRCQRKTGDCMSPFC